MPKALKRRPVRRAWRTPDALWAEIEPLLPPRKPHPLGCHNPRVDDRRAMDAIFFRLRTGCQWNALSATRLCSSSSAHRRFQEWRAAGVFLELWRRGLTEYDALKGIDWSWLAVDGAMTKAPLGGENQRAQPDGPGEAGDEAQRVDGSERRARGSGRRGREPARRHAPRADARERGDPAPAPNTASAAGPLSGQRLRRRLGVPAAGPVRPDGPRARPP
jgi:transposase